MSTAIMRCKVLHVLVRVMMQRKWSVTVCVFLCVEAALKSANQILSVENKAQALQSIFVLHVKSWMTLRGLQKIVKYSSQSWENLNYIAGCMENAEL